MSVKEEMQQAKTYIQSKRYEDARHILQKIDHPKAKQWLDRLPPVQRKSPNKNFNIKLIVSLFAISLVSVIIGFFIGYSTGANNINSVILPTEIVASVPVLPTEGVPATEVQIDECWDADWYREVRPHLIEFFDNAEIAASTPRIQLSPIVTSLRGTKRNFDAINYPECATDLRQNLSFGMGNAADAYVEFMGDNETMSIINLNSATQYFADAHDEIKERFSNNLNPDLYSLMEIYMVNTALFYWGGDDPEQYIPPESD